MTLAFHWFKKPPVYHNLLLHCGMCQHGADHLGEFGLTAAHFQRASVAAGMEHLHLNSREWLTGAENSPLIHIQTNGRLFNMYVIVCASD